MNIQRNDVVFHLFLFPKAEKINHFPTDGELTWMDFIYIPYKMSRRDYLLVEHDHDHEPCPFRDYLLVEINYKSKMQN